MVWNIVLDFGVKLENLVPLLGVKLILTEIAREDYGSRAGFETVPIQLKNFTLGRINIYWLCVRKPLYLHLLIALETKKLNSKAVFFSFPMPSQLSKLEVWWCLQSKLTKLKGHSCLFLEYAFFFEKKKTNDSGVHFPWNSQLNLIHRTLHSSRILPCFISDVLCKEVKCT